MPHFPSEILRPLWSVLLCAVLAATAAPVHAAAAHPVSPLVGRHPGYEGYLVGDAAAPTPAPVTPGMMLMGGHDWPRDAFEWLAARAGHGHIVILRASGKGELGEQFFEDIGGVASVRTFVFHARAPAGDPALLDAVRRADGIFLAGGNQANYLRFWKGTPLNAALDAHVAAGKPIGGTSAGLAVLGAFVYGALDGRSVTSARALRDPFDSSITLERDFLHLPYLQQIVTDTHFGKRERLGRLIAFVANLRAQGHAQAIGIGVDEDTALCIDGAGIGRVFTRDDGKAWLVRPGAAPTRIDAGEPLEIRDVRITGIGRDSRIDMRDFGVERPAFERIADVGDGELVLREAH